MMRVGLITTWQVAVRFDNGEEKIFYFDKCPGFAVGSAVKGSIIPR